VNQIAPRGIPLIVGGAEYNSGMQQNLTPQLPSHLAVPETAPPYDDERDQIQDHNGNVRHALPAMAFLAADRPGQSTPGRADEHGQPGSPDLASLGSWSGALPVQDRTGRVDGWPSRFAQVLAETLAGTRPVRQLTPWTTEHTRRRIVELGPLLASGQRPRVHRVLTSAPRREVLELTAVIGFGPRVRAVAVRLELAKAPPHRPGPDRWRCTHIETA
jgi:hypothetical protein